jgi:curved DNA-binding protein CbpA
MTDAFALLNEPRRPWLDADSLKRKFLALSSDLHPDRTHGMGEAEKQAAQQRYAELNAAYNCLRDPKERLRHLLELELGARPENVQRVPAGLMDFSLEISRLCREADGFLAERAAQTSPLLKAQLFTRSQEWTDELTALNRRVLSRTEELSAELRAIDAEWEAGKSSSSPDRAGVLQRLETLWRLLSYFGRWNAQIQERIVRLSV